MTLCLTLFVRRDIYRTFLLFPEVHETHKFQVLNIESYLRPVSIFNGGKS